jgi:hypothetical protein
MCVKDVSYVSQRVRKIASDCQTKLIGTGIVMLNWCRTIVPDLSTVYQQPKAKVKTPAQAISVM